MMKVLKEETGSQPAGELEAWDLDALVREGARRMLASALELEGEQYLREHERERDAEGRRLVVRNGRARPRKVTTGAGTVKVASPRVHDRRAGEKFTSRILPPWLRRSPNVDGTLPVLYLRGLSTGDFRPALKELLGEDAAGLSSANISGLLGV